MRSRVNATTPHLCVTGYRRAVAGMYRLPESRIATRLAAFVECSAIVDVV
jgi:hypothetical protein